jgi:hypothetical protein
MVFFVASLLCREADLVLSVDLAFVQTVVLRANSYFPLRARISDLSSMVDNKERASMAGSQIDAEVGRPQNSVFPSGRHFKRLPAFIAQP